VRRPDEEEPVIAHNPETALAAMRILAGQLRAVEANLEMIDEQIEAWRLQPATRHRAGRRAVGHQLHHNLICYCAMIDYVTTRKRFDAEDVEAWRWKLPANRTPFVFLVAYAQGMVVPNHCNSQEGSTRPGRPLRHSRPKA
jgi:hypothetical protein